MNNIFPNYPDKLQKFCENISVYLKGLCWLILLEANIGRITNNYIVIDLLEVANQDDIYFTSLYNGTKKFYKLITENEIRLITEDEFPAKKCIIGILGLDPEEIVVSPDYIKNSFPISLGGNLDTNIMDHFRTIKVEKKANTFPNLDETIPYSPNPNSTIETITRHWIYSTLGAYNNLPVIS